MPTVTATVPLSGSVTGDIDLRKGRLQAIWVPVITSADLMFQGAFDTLSGANSFVRLLQPTLDAPSSGDLTIHTAVGSRMIVWPDSLPTPSYLRLELGVPQSAARDFQIRFH